MTNSPQKTHNQPDWSFASQDLLDSLPKVWTRGLFYSLILVITIVLPWAMLSKVDETGKGQGKLEPQGKTIKLDAPVSGTVAAIRVKEGDTVSKGQTLVELDSEVTQTQLEQQENKLEGQQNRLSQILLLQNQLQVVMQIQQEQNQSQKLEKLAQVNQSQQNLAALNKTYEFQKNEQLSQVNQAQQNIKINQLNYQLAAKSLETGEKELKRYQEAASEEIVSQIQVVDKEDNLQERMKSYQQAQSDYKQSQLRLAEEQSSYQRTLSQAKSEIEQAQLKVKEQQSSYNSLIHSNEIALLKVKEQLENLETDATSLKSDIKQTENEIQSLKYQLNQRTIKSPVDGTIYLLSVFQKGSFLQESNKVLEIAPKNTKLILRVQMVTNQSGFIKVGLPVKIKFDAYPFQDYGIIEGKLIKISPTTSEIDTANGKASAYELEIQLNQTCIKATDKCLVLRPGDTATAEIVLRQRRIIDFILDPFKKLQKGGLEL